MKAQVGSQLQRPKQQVLSHSLGWSEHCKLTCCRDRGFDPLKLAEDPKLRTRMAEAEVFHGRTAMLAVVGACVPELLVRQQLPSWNALETGHLKVLP